MDDRPVEWQRGEYAVSTDRGRLEAEPILVLLRGEDAEQLYARAGFTPGSGPVVYMERRAP